MGFPGRVLKSVMLKTGRQLSFFVLMPENKPLVNANNPTVSVVLVSASDGTPTDRPQLDYDRLILHTKLASIFSIWQALI